MPHDEWDCPCFDEDRPIGSYIECTCECHLLDDPVYFHNAKFDLELLKRQWEAE